MLRNLRFAWVMWHMKDHAKAERDLRFSISRFRSMLSMLERRHLSFVCFWKLLLLPIIHCLTTSITLRHLGLSSMSSLSISNSHHKEQHMRSDLYGPLHFLAPYSILLSIAEMLPHILRNLWCITSKILYILKFHSCFCLFRNSLLRIPFFLQISTMVILFLSYCLSH